MNHRDDARAQTIALPKRPREQSPREIGKRIARARALRKVTQADLAVACGVSRNAVSQWELGEVRANEQHLQVAALWLNCAYDWLARARGNPPTAERTPKFKDKRREARYQKASMFDWSTDADEPPFAGAIPEMENPVGSSNAEFDAQRKLVRDWWRISQKYLAHQGLDALDLRLYRVDITQLDGKVPRGSHILIDTKAAEIDGATYLIDNGVVYALQKIEVNPAKPDTIGLRKHGRAIFVPRSRVKLVGRLVRVMSDFDD